MKETLQELLSQNMEVASGSPGAQGEQCGSFSYYCGIRLAWIDFSRFNGNNVN